MCNCIKETEVRLRERLESSKEYEGKTITEVTTENTAYIFDYKSTVEYTPVIVKYDEVNKKGEIKHKKKSIMLTHNYCATCGEKHSTEVKP